MLRVAAAFVGAFAGMLAVFVVAVGQLARIDAHTLVVALVASGGVATFAAWRSRRA